MGEAAKRIPAALKRKHSDIPWKEIAGMRDVLIHGYFGVDVKILWRTLKEDVPAIKKPLGDIIRGLPKD